MTGYNVFIAIHVFKHCSLDGFFLVNSSWAFGAFHWWDKCTVFRFCMAWIPLIMEKRYLLIPALAHELVFPSLIGLAVAIGGLGDLNLMRFKLWVIDRFCRKGYFLPLINNRSPLNPLNLLRTVFDIVCSGTIEFGLIPII